MKKELSFLLALALSLGATAQAQTVVQARSLPVLEMGADARAVAMGGNHYGTSRSAHLYTNPASIVFEPTGALIHASASWRHQAAFEGISGSLDTYSLTGGVRLGDHAIMLGGRYFQSPKITSIGGNEALGASVHPRDYTIDLGYALRLGKLSLYAMGSYVSSDLGVSSVSAYGFGAGAFYRTEWQTRSGGEWSLLVGLKGQNFGPNFRYSGSSSESQMPLYAGLGGELSYDVAEMHKLTLGLGGEQYISPYRARSTAFRGGLEYEWKRMLSLRAGYRYDTNKEKSFSLGAGVQYGSWTLDAAFVTAPIKGAGNALHLTLGCKLFRE